MLNAGPGEDRLALVILTGFLVARLLFAFAIGLGIDESYTVTIARGLALSYFDHPPLHLWIAHFAARALGENTLARLPFVGLFFATGWIYYRFVSSLFGPRPALIALFALNVTPFFFASAGSWIVPDGPLLFGLAIAAWAAGRLFFQDSQDEALAWRLWLLIGLGLGLAGLSKYSAILTAGGLAGFILLSPEQRRWLRRPAPYVAALLAFAMITPVIWWNARHGWASFVFQGGRGVPNGGLRPVQLATMALGELAFLSPWIFAPLVAGLVDALRHWRDQRRLFLLCLSLPPIALFTLTPLWGGRGQPHWTMPGWFFTFALMGAWINELGVSARALRRWAFVASALLAAIAGVAAVQASTGWPWATLTAGSSFPDPMLEGFEWRDLKDAPMFDRPPSFVISTKWSDAGKIALALGPQIPVFVLSNDPRGWAFLDESERYIGLNGVIITPAAEVTSTLAVARLLFTELGQPQFYALGRSGRHEIALALIPARGLTHGLPMPYPTAAGR
ncbi:MAG: glycosyltransferase family 39 protein [Hyphomicrobiales bacterium]|nr:glycosyltransferase family 39 protein [Hyphomicrobiales bacterium]